jgi:HAD superfamily hydrolase (TIGR01509 family)
MVAGDVRLAMQVRIILFDWGGVLSPGGAPDELTEKFEKILSISPAKTEALTKPLLAKLKRGQLSVTTFWQELETSAHQKIPQNARSIWAASESLRPNHDLLEFIDELHLRGYTIGVLSNVFPHTEQLIRQAGWYTPFAPLFLSSVIGLAKPDQAIYDYVCSSLKVKAPEILFIDDQQRCLTPAAGRGMMTILAHDPTQVIHDIREALHLE